MSTGEPPAPTGPRRDVAAFVIGVGLLVLAAVIAWDAYTIRTGAAAYARIGPRAFPYAVAACLAAVAVATLVSAFRPVLPRPKEDYGPMGWIVGGLLLQIAVLPFGGFSLATGVVFAATARAFGRGPLWFTYPIGVALCLILWLLFAKGLNLILPRGPLERLF